MKKIKRCQTIDFMVSEPLAITPSLVIPNAK